MSLSTDLTEIGKYLPVVLPLIIVELILMITSVIHVLKHENYRFGNKIVWLLVVIFIQIIGPVVYFAIGREEE